jgi:hypothetical protein
MPLTLDNSDVRTVVTASGLFDTTLVPGMQYILSTTTDCWFKVTTGAGSASAADGSHFLAAGQRSVVAAKGANNRVAIIRDAADGNASLSEVAPGA